MHGRGTHEAGPRVPALRRLLGRGADFPALQGRYFFADLCSSWLRSFAVVNGEARGFQDHTASAGPVSSVVSFGEDARGELYVASHGSSIRRIVSP